MSVPVYHEDSTDDRKKAVMIRIPFFPNFEQYARSICYEDLDDAQSEAREIFATAADLLQPTCMIDQQDIDDHLCVDDLPAVDIAGRRFIGKALGVLESVHRVFPYIVTCGNQMENFDLSPYDFLAPYWLDVLKVQALTVACEALHTYCSEQFGIQKPLSVNPGSGNIDIWPIEQMQDLFAVLGGKAYVAARIGVRLTESSLMIPNKTIAGILFTSAELDYESCAYCERLSCPSRRVPFTTRM